MGYAVFIVYAFYLCKEYEKTNFSKYPVLISFISGTLFAMPIFLRFWCVYKDKENYQIIIGMLVTCFTGVAILLLINFFTIILNCILLLLQIKDKPWNLAVKSFGVSAFYQVLLFSCFALGITYHRFGIIIFIFIILRFFAYFCGVLRITGQNQHVAMLGTLCCFDCWLILYTIFRCAF